MKSVLNYFVRKAFGFTATAKPTDKTLFGHLLRIRQNIHEVYEWLYGKVCGSADGTVPRRMPMTDAVVDPQDGHEVLRPVAQNSDNLLAHLALLNGRKISNGYADGRPAADGLPDGVSLARILCDSTLQPTELVDDNVGWTMDKTPTLPSTLTKLVLNCKEMNNARIKGYANIEELEMPALEVANYDGSIVSYQNEGFVQDMSCTEVTFPSLRLVKVNGYGTFLSRFNQLQKAYFPALVEFNMPWQGGVVCECPTIEEIYMPALTTISTSNDGRYKLVIDCPNLKKVVFGKNPIPNFACRCFVGCPNLLHLEFAEVSTSLYLGTWQPSAETLSNPLFLQNFRSYIASRLADRTGSSTLTLTLSAEVYAAVTADQDIYDLITSKNWNIAQA